MIGLCGGLLNESAAESRKRSTLAKQNFKRFGISAFLRSPVEGVSYRATRDG